MTSLVRQRLAWSRFASSPPSGRGFRSLRRIVAHDVVRNAPRAMVAGVLLWLAIGLWIAIVPIVRPPLLNERPPGPGLDDFGVFYSAARMVRQGEGPQLYSLDALARQESQVYQRPANAASSLPFFNPPAFAAALVPLTFLPVGTAAAIFLAVTTVLAAGAMALLWRRARAGYVTGWIALAMAFVFQATQDNVVHGQVSLILLFAFATAFVCFSRKRDGWAGFALGLLLLKPNVLIAPLAVLLWKRRARALAGFAAMGAIWLVISIAAAGPAIVLRYPEFLRQAAAWDDQHAIGISGMFGWNALVRNIVGPGKQDSVLLWSGILSVITIAATLWTWRGRWNEDARSMSTQFSALVLCSVLINPHVYRQEMMVLFIPGLLLVGATEGRSRVAMALLLSGAWGVVLFHVPILHKTGWSISAPVMAVMLCVALWMTLRRQVAATTPDRRLRLAMPPLAPAIAYSPAPGAALTVPRPFSASAAMPLPSPVGPPVAIPLPAPGAAPAALPAIAPVASTDRPLLSVVIPTRNERENVGPLATRVAAALAGIDFEVVFVDDSTDDTPEMIARLDDGFPVTLIHRQPSERRGGLTTAILRGLRVARGRYVSVIDGDLQHPPEKLAELLGEAARSGADVVVASRYRAGGSAEGLPGRSRRLVSLGSKWISKVLFYERLRHCSDPGSGFFLLRRDVIEGVELRPVGYKMLTEILVRGSWSTISEVPYRFQSRERGASNAGLRQGLQYLHHTLRIFVEVPDVAHVWKFLTVGATGVVVNLGVLWAATLAGLSPHTAWGLGVETSILSNFWWNHTFTWRDRRARGVRGVAAELARYHLASAAGVIANFIVFTAAALLGVPTLLAGMLGIGGGMTANFAGATRFVFLARPNARAAASRAPAPEPTTAEEPPAQQWEGSQPWQ